MTTPCPIQMVYGPSAQDVSPDPLLNAIIPMTGRYLLSSKIVYAEDEWQYLYTEYTLQFDLVVYENISTGLADIEAEVARLRTILNTPNYKLKIYPIGVGQFGVINYTHFDVKGGPFPQDIVVEKFTSNKAISVRGSLMFRLSPCITATSPGVEPTTNQLVQHSVEQDINVNEDGIVEFTFHFTAQYFSALPDASGGPMNREILQTLSNTLIRRVDKTFQGMKKKTRTSISRDGRIGHIRVVYTEHESDSAFHPYTRNISLTDDLESSLLGEGKGKGFYVWRRNLDCTIKVPHRIHKAWAWFIFKRIIRERFKNLQLLDKAILTPVGTKPTEQPLGENRQECWYIPIRIKISNNVYDRTIKFTVAYMVTCSLKEIITNTKILDGVDAYYDIDNEVDPGLLADQWYTWQGSQSDLRINGVFGYTSTDMPMTYNQCTNTVDIPTVGANTEDPVGFTNPPTVGTPPEPESNEDDEVPIKPVKPYGGPAPEIPASLSWLKYDNEFEIIEDSSLVAVSYLEEPDQGSSPTRKYYQAGDSSTPPARIFDGVVLNNRTEGVTQEFPVETIARGHSLFYVRMTGYSLRYGYKPPIPYIVSIGGRTVKRLHSRSSIKQAAIGEHPVHLTKWDVLYVVEGGDPYSSDIAGSIVTSGNPEYYA